MPLPANYVGTETKRSKGKRLITPIDVLSQTWTNPVAAVTNGIVTTHAGASTAGTVNNVPNGSLAAAGIATNGHARNVVITVTHATAVVAMSGTITGTDIAGQVQSEAWSVTAGTASKTFTGKKAFKTVTSVTETVAADASANTIIVGNGVLLGMENPLEITSPLKEYSAGSLVTNGTFVARSTATTDDAKGTYSPNTAPNGATSYIVYYLSLQPEISK